MQIALATLPYPESPDDAVAQTVRSVAMAAEHGAALVAFPEAYIPGYRGLGRDPGFVTQAFLDRAWANVSEAAAKSKIGVVLGTERYVGSQRRLTAVVFGSDGANLGIQDKVQLDPSEDEIYAPGDKRHVFNIANLTFGVVICHEGWRYPETVRWAARRSAKLVFHLHLSESETADYRPMSYADPANTFHEKAALCRAAENTIYYAGVNYATPKSNAASAVVRPDGSLMAWHPHREPGLLVAELDLSLATGRLAHRCRS